jgi:signal transduction histidine kinase
MQCLAADGSEPVSAALDVLANRLGLGLVLAGPGGALLFANRRALELFCGASAPDAEEIARGWERLRARLPDGVAGPEAVAFTAELSVTADATPRMLRGQCRKGEDGATEILLSDRRALGALDLELLCASRMKEWVHQCEALVHDANGALNTIQLTLELLDGQWPGSRAVEQGQEPHRRNHVSVIRDNLDRLKRVLRELVLAHEEPAAGPFDLCDVVREAVAILKMPARRRRIELDADFADGALQARGNRARLRQALVNVALCRIEALPERSKLRLEARRLDAARVALGCADNGSLPGPQRTGIYQLLLADGGAGSPSDALRLARAIVESEGGAFEVEASEAGTQLRLVVPAARP